ncbi:30499_t:CDS:2 [Gigaspora margarita]|uniref:30499_t:CDS:1 n=1 Tax=Gigaspora margarita TaxID=4874 RepID=A0ABN7UUS3_GIGMA|nr:30499_t:CDS:2 [Gigaspora margarita]
MEDGKEYIGRLAISKTESEVAVIEYNHLNMHIPVFKVYYWNSSVNNPVGTKYILIEYLSAIKDNLMLKTEKELNVITGNIIITYKMDKTSKLDKTNALQELKHITRNNLLHELEADFKFYNYLMIIT